MFFRNVARNNLLRQAIRKSVCRNSTRTAYAVCSSGIKLLNRKERTIFNKPTVEKWQNQLVRNYSSYPPHIKVPLPALSPTMETGTILSWEKKEGDKLNEGDLLAEIETDKATMGFETPEEGYLAKIVVPAGVKNIPIGQLVCIIVEKQEDIAKFKDFKDDGAPAAPAAAKAPTPAAPAAAPPAAAPSAAAPAAPSAAAPAAPAAAAPTGRIFVSPMAKGLAEKKNIRLQGKGSGLFGSITSKDLDKLAAASAGAPSAVPKPHAAASTAKAPAPAPGNAYIDIPITQIRAVIAKRLVESKTQIPHFYITVRVKMDNLIKFRTRINKKLEKKGAKLTVTDFIVKATAAASKRIPEANSSWLGDVIRQYKNVDVSVAVATPKGLITPIIFEANDKGVIQISKELAELAKRARDGKLQPHEFQGGNICISNLGMMGVLHFNAVINPPHSAIIGIGATEDHLVPDDSEKGFKVVKVMYVTISGDHRVVDGAVAAEWLQLFRDNIEEPENMIL